MSRQPEPRTGRDGIPVRAERRAKLDKVFEPLLDGVQQLGDTIDALADTARDQKHPVEDDERGTNLIDDAIAAAFGKPVPPRSPFSETTPTPDPFGEPQEPK